jgi:hypothetical protein
VYIQALHGNDTPSKSPSGCILEQETEKSYQDLTVGCRATDDDDDDDDKLTISNYNAMADLHRVH